MRAVVCGLAGLLVPGGAAGVGEGRGEPEAFARRSAVRPAGKTELKGLEELDTPVLLSSKSHGQEPNRL